MSDVNHECPFAQHVDAYVDGELEPALNEEMHRHVFSCASCSAMVRQTMDISASISAIETKRLPENVRNRMHSATASRWDGGTMRFLRYMSGIAAVILVGASIWVARMGSVSPEASTPGVNSTDTQVTEWIVRDLSHKDATKQRAQPSTAPEQP